MTHPCLWIPLKIAVADLVLRSRQKCSVSRLLKVSKSFIVFYENKLYESIYISLQASNWETSAIHWV